jgi:hypothetical protein
VAMVDTIGGVWSYQSIGVYRYTKVGAFADVTKIFVTISDNSYQQGADTSVSFDVGSDDYLILKTRIYDQFLTPGTLTPTNGRLFAQPILIEVYP